VVKDFGGSEGNIGILKELFEVADSCFQVKDVARAINRSQASSFASFSSFDLTIHPIEILAEAGKWYSPPRNLPLGDRIIAHTFHISLLTTHTRR
jgi:hypothetical protein